MCMLRSGGGGGGAGERGLKIQMVWSHPKIMIMNIIIAIHHNKYKTKKNNLPHAQKGVHALRDKSF
jgi:hypothetical protein